MDTIHIKQLDAFTQEPFTGNPAGVVLDADTLTDREMQLVAREMNVSETAFVEYLEEEEWGDIRLRWFTPGQEVDLCGHATIAAIYALAEAGRLGIQPGVEQTLGLQTRSGQLMVDVEWVDERPYIRFHLPWPTFDWLDYAQINTDHFLNLPANAIDTSITPAKDQNGYLYLALKQAVDLCTLEADMRALKSLYHQNGITALALVQPLYQEQCDWRLRFFAPALGVDEDPVTGSANGPAAVWLGEQNKLDSNPAFGVQGFCMQRKGTVKIEWDNNAQRLSIAGTAITMLEGNMVLQTDLL